MDCKYSVSTAVCHPAAWVAAMVCDKCEATATVEICDYHFKAFQKYKDKTGPGIACDECYGSISFSAQNLYDPELIEEYINPL